MRPPPADLAWQTQPWPWRSADHRFVIGKETTEDTESRIGQWTAKQKARFVLSVVQFLVSR
jgi:hypothetical protein